MSGSSDGHYCPFACLRTFKFIRKAKMSVPTRFAKEPRLKTWVRAFPGRDPLRPKPPCSEIPF